MSDEPKLTHCEFCGRDVAMPCLNALAMLVGLSRDATCHAKWEEKNAAPKTGTIVS